MLTITPNQTLPQNSGNLAPIIKKSPPLILCPSKVIILPPPQKIILPPICSFVSQKLHLKSIHPKTMTPLKFGITVRRTLSQMSDLQLHKYTNTALCGSSFLDLRFGLLGIKQLVRLRSKLQIYTLCNIF